MKKDKYSLDDIPTEVAWFWARTRIGDGFMGSEEYQKYLDCVKKYPEWFPEETEYNRIWDSIPQSVHDAYQKEADPWHILSDRDWNKFNDKIGERPHPELQANGIIWTVTTGYDKYPKEVAEMDEWNRKYWDLESKEQDAIWEKHYGVYGLKRQK